MFTGIVENTGFARGLSSKKDVYKLKVLITKRLDSLKEGSSLSINGACLTLVSAERDFLTFDVMRETFAKTSLRFLRYNEIVNIERALLWKSRIDGHFVSGHVDSVQRIKAIRKSHFPYIDIPIEKGYKKYVVQKGSIAIDGISLTVGEVYNEKIRLHIIPYTLLHTNLKHKKAGDRVNIEFDILAKYVENKTPSFA